MRTDSGNYSGPKNVAETGDGSAQDRRGNELLSCWESDGTEGHLPPVLW